MAGFAGRYTSIVTERQPPHLDDPDGPPRTLPDGTVLRPLSEERGELEACVAVQRAIWGQEFADVASPQILRIVQSMGGVAAGAFTGEGDETGETGEMLGFVFGVTGFKHGRPMHWSHMLAVLPAARGRDLGFHLKQYQRERLVPLGIGAMRWTYDPLVSKNAFLNLVRLGARVLRYQEDYYGSGEDSALSAGLGTDRFIVEWRLDGPGPPDREPGEGGADAEADLEADRAPVVNDFPEAVSGEPVVRIEIPGDIQEVRRGSPEIARAWRSATRRAFVSYLASGYEVTGFHRRPEGSFYVLRKAET